MNSKTFWLLTVFYVLITVFISKALSLDMFVRQKEVEWVVNMSILNKFFYAFLKTSIGLIYLRLVRIGWGNSLLILITGLLIRTLYAPFTMVIIGCSIALHMKDSLINTNSKKINQNPD